MKKRIWSAFYHGISTDENPQHQFCSEQWCFYLQAQKKGLESSCRHEDLVKTSFSPEIQDKVKATYIRLTRDELLKGCVDGLTQNANECFHSVVWSIFPKVYLYCNILVLLYNIYAI